MLYSVENCRSAHQKLKILLSGVTVDCVQLEKQLPDYRTKYRVKRQQKYTAIENGKMFDMSIGETYIPQELVLEFPENGKLSIVKLNNNPDSEIELTVRDGILTLHDNMENWTLPVRMLPALPNSGAASMLGGDRIGIMGYQGCSGWLQKCQCRFCDNVALRKNETTQLPNLNDLENLERSTLQNYLKKHLDSYAELIIADYEQLSSLATPHIHPVLMSGNLPYSDLCWEYHLALAQKVASAIPWGTTDSYLNLLPPPDRMWLEKARDIGFRNVVFNMEVWGEKAYAAVCPEKSRLLKMADFLARLDDAVAIFGPGHVHCGFVFGAQDFPTLAAGCHDLISRGVSCNMTVFTPKPGTPWENKKRPNYKTVAEFSGYLAGLLKANNLSPLYCRMSSRSEAIWELLEDTPENII